MAELSEHVQMLACSDAERDLLRGSRFRRRQLRRCAYTTGETDENDKAAGTARPRRCRPRAAQNATSARPVRRDRPDRPAGPGYCRTAQVILRRPSLLHVQFSFLPRRLISLIKGALADPRISLPDAL